MPDISIGQMYAFWRELYEVMGMPIDWRAQCSRPHIWEQAEGRIARPVQQGEDVATPLTVDPRTKVNFEFWQDQMYKVVRTPCPDPNAALKAAAGQAAVRIPALFKINDEPVIAACNPAGQMTLAARVKKLKLRTTFITDRGKLVPRFTPNPPENAVVIEPEWTVPSGIKLFFGLQAQFTGHWKAIMGYLFFQCGVPGTWKLPLPNQYPDGRLCMGNDLQRIAAGTAAECLQMGIDSLNNSTWGTDFIPDITKTHMVFKFDPATMKQLACDGNWIEGACVRFSNQVVNDLFQ